MGISTINVVQPPQEGSAPEPFINYDQFPSPAQMILQGALGTSGITDAIKEGILFKSYFLTGSTG
jgi:hypothetical protein